MTCSPDATPIPNGAKACHTKAASLCSSVDNLTVRKMKVSLSLTLDIAAWPRMSSGHVGSSIQRGLKSARLVTHLMASATSHLWFASIIWHVNNLWHSCRFKPRAGSSHSRTRVLLGPIIFRMRRHRRLSSSKSAPTFTLNLVHPFSSASVQSCGSTVTFDVYFYSDGGVFSQKPVWAARPSIPAMHRR